ncbi:MAG: fatty acid desaturase [Candidatus Wallbacteria bacterium]|nr:fatty acid desaturase [Candidatus Wallbacteria bacterium]
MTHFRATHVECRAIGEEVGEQARREGLDRCTAGGMAAPVVASLLLLGLIVAGGQAAGPLWAVLVLAAGYCNVVLAFVGHDAAHGAYSPNRAANELAGMWSLAHSFTTLRGFRALHQAHHRHTGFDEDPTGDSPRHLGQVNLISYCLFILVPLGFPLFVVLPSWLGGFGYQPHVFPPEERAGIRFNCLFVLAHQAAFYGLASWLGGPSGPGFALAGFVCGLWLTTMMNALAHAGVQTYTDCRLCNTRTIRSGRLLGLMTANGGYHVEHHLLPHVPWYHLPRLHALIRERGGSAFVGESYLGLHLTMASRYARGGAR